MQGEPLAPDDLAALTGEAIRIEDAEPAMRASLPHSEALPIVLSLLCNLFLTALDQTIVATALPTIGVQFHDVSNLSWVITAYLLASTAVAPVYGTLSDIYGRRAMLITANALFLVGSVLCALAPNLLFLILARVLQGLGGGGLLPLGQTLIADVVTPRDRGRYQGYISMVWVTAGIGGPVLGGVFAQHLHWSMIFWINLPIGVGALMLLLPRLRKVPDFHRHRKLDWAGGLLLMVSAVIFLLALTWGGHKFAWLSPTILGMIGSAVVLMAAFVIHARTTEEPFLPLPLISGPVVPYSMIAGGSAMGTMIAMIVHLPIYYEAVYRLSASEAGIALIPLVAVSVFGAWSAGQFMAVTGRYKWVAFGGASVAASCLLLMAYLAAPPLWVLLSLLAVLALGIGTCFPISVVSIQNAVPRSQVGTATGAMNFFRSLMSSFAVAVFTAILLAAIGQDIPIGEGVGGGGHNIPSADMVIGFRFVFLTAAFLMVLAATLFALMEERPLAGGKPSPAAAMVE